MAKKLLRKREVHTDLNPNHFNKYGKPHNAIISAKQGHKYKANTIRLYGNEHFIEELIPSIQEINSLNYSNRIEIKVEVS